MRRWLPFVIILAVALAAAGGGWALYRSKMQPHPQKTAAHFTPPPAMPSDPKGFHVRGGPANAPVILEIYGDFQCPACATASAIIDKIAPEYGSKLRVIFYEFPLKMHPHAMEAAQAAEAAAEQDRFWEMHDQLYQYQTAWSDATNVRPLFDNYAQAIGLDVARFDADLTAQDLLARIRRQATTGDTRGVMTTPTIFINGQHLHGYYTERNLRQAIESELARKQKQ